MRILRASLVQIDTEMAEKYANQRYSVSSHWKICRRMCVRLMGLVTLTFDFLTLKLVCESHQRRGTFSPNLGTLDLWVLELFAMYCPFSTDVGIIMLLAISQLLNCFRRPFSSSELSISFTILTRAHYKFCYLLVLWRLLLYDYLCTKYCNLFLEMKTNTVSNRTP